MDVGRFERLSRRVGAAGSRRDAVTALAAALLAPALGALRPQEAAAGIPIVSCKIPGQRCHNDTNCCTGRCKKGSCRCAPKGHDCWTPLEGAMCCSGRCRSGKCK